MIRSPLVLRICLLTAALNGRVLTSSPAIAGDPCRSGIAAGDTLRFTVTTEAGRSGGEMLIWRDSDGTFGYRESEGPIPGRSTTSGSVRIGADTVPSRLVFERQEGDGPSFVAARERVGDSAVMRRDTVRSVAALPSGFMPSPGFQPSPAIAVIGQCA